MTQLPDVLNDEARRVVRQPIADHRVVRGSALRAGKVRMNHVHVVVSRPPEVTLERVMTEFKQWATRRLGEVGLIPPGGRLWTRDGRRRWIARSFRARGSF